MPFLHFGAAAKDAVLDRMAGGIAKGFHAERRVSERGDQVAVKVPGGVRRDRHALLFRVVRDAQRFGEAGGARGVELHETDGPGIDEIADRVAMPFALAVRQRDRRCRGETDVVGRLQMPEQRFLQPEDVVWRDRLGEADAAGDVVRRVHIEHEQDVGTDCLAHATDARDFVLQRQCTGFQLHRAVAGGDVLREFIGVGSRAMPLRCSSRPWHR